MWKSAYGNFNLESDEENPNGYAGMRNPDGTFTSYADVMKAGGFKVYTNNWKPGSDSNSEIDKPSNSLKGGDLWTEEQAADDPRYHLQNEVAGRSLDAQDKYGPSSLFEYIPDVKAAIGGGDRRSVGVPSDFERATMSGLFDAISQVLTPLQKSDLSQIINKGRPENEMSPQQWAQFVSGTNPGMANFMGKNKPNMSAATSLFAPSAPSGSPSTLNLSQHSQPQYNFHGLYNAPVSKGAETLQIPKGANTMTLNNMPAKSFSLNSLFGG